MPEDRLLLAAALVGSGALWGFRVAGPATILVVVTGGVLAALALLGPLGPERARVAGAGRLAILAMTPLAWGMLTTLPWTTWRDYPSWLPVSATVVGGAAACGITWAVLRRERAGGVLVAGYLTVGLVVVLLCPVVIDVRDFIDHGIAAMVGGTSPYATTITSPFDDATNARLFPEGLVVDGEIQTGFAYPSVPLLFLVPGWLLGDARLMVWTAWALLVLILWRLDRGPGHTTTWLVAICPGGMYIVGFAWVEPISLLLVAVAAASFQRGSRYGPVLLGLGLASKQYFVLVLPLCLLLLPAARRLPGGVRGTVVGVAAGALVPTLPFVLWDPAAWWSSVVEFTLEQPFREDSLSLPATWAEMTGEPGSAAALTTLAPVLAIGVAVLVAWRAPRTPAAFCAGSALVLLVATIFSKQAFPNYYYLAAGLLLVAAWLVADEKHAPERSDAQGTDPVTV